MRKVRSILILIGILMLALSVTGVFAQDQNIAEVAAGNADLSILVDLVTKAGLAETLTGEGPLTVYAPTNEAFAALPADVVTYLTSDEGLPYLTEILTYHVVTGDGMMEGAPASAMDVEASNGVIHVIDSVLLPEITLPEVDTLSWTNPITSAGSSTVGPLTEAINTRLAEEGYTSVTNATTGTGAGFQRFCANELDFSNASRPISQEEIDSCAANNLAPVEFRVGTDALAVVVSAENDFVDTLTFEQLQVVFSTAVTWADVNPEWPAETILRYIPGTDSGTFDYFVEEVFNEDTVPVLNAANLELSENDNVLVAGIEGSPYAIGFFGYAYYAEEAGKLKILSLDFGNGPIEANEANVDNATYPLARPLFIYSDVSKIAANPALGPYINYYLTNVNEVIVPVGYFAADDAALNLSRLQLLALMHEAAM